MVNSLRKISYPSLSDCLTNLSIQADILLTLSKLLYLETRNTVLKFATYSVVELFKKTSSEDFNSVVDEVILVNWFQQMWLALKNKDL